MTLHEPRRYDTILSRDHYRLCSWNKRSQFAWPQPPNREVAIEKLVCAEKCSCGRAFIERAAGRVVPCDTQVAADGPNSARLRPQSVEIDAGLSGKMGIAQKDVGFVQASRTYLALVHYGRLEAGRFLNMPAKFRSGIPYGIIRPVRCDKCEGRSASRHQCHAIAWLIARAGWLIVRASWLANAQPV